MAARRHRDQGAQVEGYILRGVIPLFGRIKVADLKPADLADGLKNKRDVVTGLPTCSEAT